MKSVNIYWRIFRTVCIVQLILVAFKGILSFSQLFYAGNKLVGCIDMIAYALVFLFVYHGLSMLNYNYPDIPLSQKQKRSFNILYLINFILIAFLFAQVVNTWWLISFLLNSENIRNKAWYTLAAQSLISWLIFIIHLVFLTGMYQLRRFIHKNTIGSWYEQFDQKP